MCKPEDESPNKEQLSSQPISNDAMGSAVTSTSITESARHGQDETTPMNSTEPVQYATDDTVEIEPEAPADKDEKEQEESRCRRWTKRAIKFYWDNEFLILVVAAILLARAYPPLGADYLQPDITATWIAVAFIFLMAGLGLKTEEFSKAFQRIYFNGFVQLYNFMVVSSVVFGVSRGLHAAGWLSQDLADGMVVGACLPMTINMVLVLNKSAGGDEAAAIFNAAFGNMVGVFLSPVLILGYLGVSGEIDLVTVFYKLALRVVLPVVVGQILQRTSKSVVAFVKKNKKYFKAAQQYCLVFIVYTVFCRTFESGSDSSIGDIFLMILFQFICLTGLMVLAWYSLRLLFRDQPKLRVMGLFGCTHKTVAMGVPLINAIYSDNPAIGLYTLPLLIWHPMQLVIGTFLSPRLSAFVDRENERLGIVPENEDDEEPHAGSPVPRRIAQQSTFLPPNSVVGEKLDKAEQGQLSALAEEEDASAEDKE